MTDYRIFNNDDAMRFADKHSELFGDHSKLSAEEFGDGNLNLVFRVSNDKGTSLIVKQALPYARCVGESWPLSTDRARIEAEVLRVHARFCPEHTVEIRHFDAELSAILMEDLKQYTILRTALIKGKQYEHVATQIGHYLAHTLFYTSDFVLTGPAKKAAVAQFINPDLCQITEDLFFTDPYCNHERNNIHDLIISTARELWQDEALQAEVAALKADFLSKPQALLHGDLHSGSIFANAENCKVIDAEFGFYGPIGFDVGSLLANFCLNYLGCAGLLADAEAVTAHQAYVRQQCLTLWHVFAEQFSQLMSQDSQDPMLRNSLYQKQFLQQVFADAIGYAGCELIRRTVGLAHVADLDNISNAQQRANIEKQAIELGRRFITQRQSLSSIEQVLDLLPV
ncbi:S-methyl-5-thioribose kinase [Rheinheimera sp. UJ51]|uniref:S-methyl-5-thioribose kinase n=1 Tax=Rheinheimera sp. UJ51 TaxID=2892446 RepID=UPI001E59366A|nr:S-methyl-5-thioribose kinase [Rheinheimera sp. UJ51]MCC5452237.1 S-methyl-5-thioribose kinase [Rheinheimera sp. UJ51]